MGWTAKVVLASLWATAAPAFPLLLLSAGPGGGALGNEGGALIVLGGALLLIPVSAVTAIVGINLSKLLLRRGYSNLAQLLVPVAVFAAPGALGALGNLPGTDCLPHRLGAPDCDQAMTALVFAIFGANLGLAWGVLNFFNPPSEDLRHG